MSSKSSRRWLERQRRDPYVKQARRQGLASRASFKLEELDQRERLFRNGMTVIDLGAAPGGWSRYAAGRVGSGGQRDGRQAGRSGGRPAGRVVALDLLEMDVPDGVEFLQGDFREQVVLDELLARIGDRGADLVISDMAPNMSGIRSADQARAMYLAELALEFAGRVLVEGGGLLVKLFHGEGFDDFVRSARVDFAITRVRKPPASRADSREVYLLSRNFRGRQAPN